MNAPDYMPSVVPFPGVTIPSTPPEEPNVYLDRMQESAAGFDALNARVLDAIRASSLDQFTTALAWAQWCHTLSMAAGDGDTATVDAMTNQNPTE